MSDAGNGTVSESTSGYDTWTVTPSGSGWMIKDNRTSKYLTDSGGTLITCSTATVFTARPISHLGSHTNPRNGQANPYLTF
jgi:hypothetical protein